MANHPFRVSLIFAISYIVLCSIYIWFSGIIAVQMSNSLPGLQNIELYKGLAFVTITGIIIFTFSFFTLRRIKQQHHELNMQRRLLLQSQAHALAGTFASGIAHDINNVLTAVDFGLSEIADSIPDSKKEHFNRVNKSYTMIREMAERLLKMGKNQTTQADMKPVELEMFISETINFAKRHRKLKLCTIKLIKDEPSTLNINPFLFEQMLINLMLNAADATNQEGIVELHIKKTEGNVAIEVHDNGPGISEENRERIFQPFHTTKTDGTGLGLSTVKICTELHKGIITVDKSPLGGALFRMLFPV
jgi:two-component system sensor histidine kinase HydH